MLVAPAASVQPWPNAAGEVTAIDGRPLRARYDGHANCFIESGFNKGLLIDFNYDVEPLPGKFPGQCSSGRGSLQPAAFFWV